MNSNIIQTRLDQYHCKTTLEEENALKEITQEVVLMALSRSGFFRFAEFHGGTALRIIYGLPRFSEDLDFALLKSSKNFIWSEFFKVINEELSIYGYDAELVDRSKMNVAVKKAFIKDNSIGKILTFSYPNILHLKKIRIKLEVDINPAVGSKSEIKYLDFPLPFSIRLQTLPSLFAGKVHALLCRSYMKGRDWFDFVWYVSRKTEINYQLLQNALKQMGPWENQKIEVNKSWILSELENKILHINWHFITNDVIRFLKPQDQKSLEVWSKEFFISRLEKLSDYLS
ncbi:MAG: nucleotidyl transferase AbiEii/AbiGii toxin family protein [Gammaproteobacteria bacterium]|nr:nucleotidyl transferase AbiEii/AbiGii toxin family protein [Gammaproteobacteria bacterium]